MALTDTALKAAKPKERPYKLFDERGLYLLVAPNGSRGWRFKYRLGGKEKLLSFGIYPDVSLKRARDKRDEARRLVADGIDPSAKRQAEKQAQADSFEAIAREWEAKFSPNWTPHYAKLTIRRLERNVFPLFGSRSIRSITAPDLLSCLRKIESRGALETAHRILQQCGQIFRYAIATGRAERDLSADLRGALPPTKVTHHASIIDPVQIGGLLRAIDGYDGSFTVRSALRVAPLVFVRPGELRHAEWDEFELEGKTPEWRIPAAKMKMREQHIVPLSKQAVAIFSELRPFTGESKFVFPALRDRGRPMSENTVNVALRALGYTSDQMTGHGFRSMASTLLNEQGWNRDAIERQLAHTERDEIRAAYNYAEHLPERRKMMQAWADYLDGLKIGAKVAPIKKRESPFKPL